MFTLLYLNFLSWSLWIAKLATLVRCLVSAFGLHMQQNPVVPEVYSIVCIVTFRSNNENTNFYVRIRYYRSKSGFRF